MSAMALNLRRWRMAVGTHDVENPAHTSFGIGLCHYDIERLGLEVGEELWSGITLHEISVVSGNFRVMCDGEHDECSLQEKEDRDHAEETIEIIEGKPLETVGA